MAEAALMHREDDPVAALAEWISAMDVTSRRTTATLRRSERNRLSLLVVHGLAALVIAPLFFAQTAAPGGMDSPTFVVLRLVPAAPYTLSTILTLGGLLLVPATLAHNRQWEMTGLLLLIVWYLTIAVAYAAAIAVWARAGYPASGRPSLFAPALYLHLGIIMLVHWSTLRRLTQRERAGS